jgi:hypothetical protein
VLLRPISTTSAVLNPSLSARRLWLAIVLALAPWLVLALLLALRLPMYYTYRPLSRMLVAR